MSGLLWPFYIYSTTKHSELCVVGWGDLRRCLGARGGGHLCTGSQNWLECMWFIYTYLPSRVVKVGLFIFDDTYVRRSWVMVCSSALFLFYIKHILGVKPLTLVRPSWVTVRSSAGSSWLQLTMRRIKSLSSIHQPSHLTRWPITDLVLRSSSTRGSLVGRVGSLMQNFLVVAWGTWSHGHLCRGDGENCQPWSRSWGSSFPRPG